MAVKDYYKILELPPTATITAVKKSFRRLALRYHPDTNQGNRYAEAWYREIQEAYETLANVELREAYLQERWLLKSQGRSFSDTVPLTPPFILGQAAELLEQVKNMDHFRMSELALQQQILFVADDEKIDLLLSYNEKDINREIGELLIACMFPLQYPDMKTILKQLNALARKNEAMLLQIRQFENQKKRQYLWERYQPLVIFLITILLCVIIYFLS